MVASKQDIRKWLGNAHVNHTHMIGVCDTFDYEDYPVYVSDEEDIRECYEDNNNRNMRKVMEVYDLRIDIEHQLKEARAFHF